MTKVSITDTYSDDYHVSVQENHFRRQYWVSPSDLSINSGAMSAIIKNMDTIKFPVRMVSRDGLKSLISMCWQELDQRENRNYRKWDMSGEVL